jgi:TRAP-type mannitol/chloroaromatic compound transport system permease large subunit
VTASMIEILVIWLAALLLGVPMFASMGLAAFAFVALNGMPVDIVPQKIAQSVNSFPLLAAPLFVLMGNIMNSAGITDRIFAFATACVGWVRGGLCHEHPGQRHLRRHVRFRGCRRRRRRFTRNPRHEEGRLRR